MATPPSTSPGPVEDGDTGRNADDGDTGRNADDAGTETGTGDGRGRPCPLCGAGMVRRHCEYVCPRHGVVYDCSDTFW